MDEKFRRLIELGAGEFEHVNGSVMAHLEGTRCLLKSWQACDTLLDAALYHGAYESPAFESEWFGFAQRQEVVAIIGQPVEELVYHYCACNRIPFFTQFSEQQSPLFYNRLTNSSLQIAPSLLANVCELTVANELDIALHDSEFVEQHGHNLNQWFSTMQPFLSLGANRKVQQVFGGLI
jgi:hypothetical protein